jgi:hypothetical protein
VIDVAIFCYCFAAVGLVRYWLGGRIPPEEKAPRVHPALDVGPLLRPRRANLRVGLAFLAIAVALTLVTVASSAIG